LAPSLHFCAKILIFSYLSKKNLAKPSPFSSITLRLLACRGILISVPPSQAGHECFYTLELSSQVQHLMIKGLKRRLPSQTFAWTVIQFIHSLLDSGIGILRQIMPLWKIFAQ
ncbi:hypothetical protein JOC27_002299, partial [Sporolactobacillus spathodeae]